MSAKDLAARAAKVNKRPAAEEPPAKRSAAAPRIEPVRLSVDVSPVIYKRVSRFAEDMGLPEAAGKARIPTVEVFRALAEELAVNEELREQVAARILANVSK